MIEKKNLPYSLYAMTILFAIYIGWCLGKINWTEIKIDTLWDTIVYVMFHPLQRPYYTVHTPVCIGSLCLILMLAFAWQIVNSRNYMPGKEYGTARLAHPKAINRITEDKRDIHNNKCHPSPLIHVSSNQFWYQFQ